MQTLPQLWKQAVAATNEALHEVGLLGRYNADGTVEVRVPNSNHRAYVRVGAAEITGTIEALNMGVPWLENIPVRMLKLGSVWIIVGVDYSRRELAANEFNVAPHSHLASAGLGSALSAGAPQNATIRVGRIVVPLHTSNVRLVPESGTVDNLDVIEGGDDGQMLLLATAAVGSTITVRGYTGVAVGNIDMRGSGNHRVLSDPHDSVLLVYRVATAHWEEVSPVTLNQLIGVVIESPADGDVLTFDAASGNWINLPPV